MVVRWLGLQEESRALGRCFYFNEHNSHREKATFYVVLAVIGAGILLIFLRAFGVVSFDDPLVEKFVNMTLYALGLAAAYVFGSIHKGERTHSRGRRQDKEGR